MSWQQQYLDRYYPRSRGWMDGTAEFHRLCAEVIPHGGKLLEIGAGPSNKTSRFLSSLGRLSGVDIDPAVLTNDQLTDAHAIEGDRYPYADASFDACISNYVLEHVSDPVAHLTEIARVLQPGGVYVFRTPNLLHYVSLISWATPHWFHEKVANRARNLASTAHAPYPTCYRLNSAGAIRRTATAARLTVEQLRRVEKEPSYGLGSRLLFLLFMAYERAVNATDRLSVLRANIFGVLRKPLN